VPVFGHALIPDAPNAKDHQAAAPSGCNLQQAQLRLAGVPALQGGTAHSQQSKCGREQIFRHFRSMLSMFTYVILIE
jgi:hypothetical protein